MRTIRALDLAPLGAKIVPFGGWAMPLSYPEGTLAEHRACRTGHVVFDVSHLGKATVSGPGAADFVNACFTNDLHRLGPGQAQYTLCCATPGGAVDWRIGRRIRPPVAAGR